MWNINQKIICNIPKNSLNFPVQRKNGLFGNCTEKS